VAVSPISVPDDHLSSWINDWAIHQERGFILNLNHTKRGIIAVTLLLSLFVTYSIGAQPDKIAIHLEAPDEAYTHKYDPLVAEASLRAVAGALASQHNIYAKFTPASSKRNKVFPRITVSPAPLPPVKTLRLVRRGDLFIYLAKVGHYDFIELHRQTVSMPKKTYVGIMVSAYYDRNIVEAQFSNIRLNGKVVNAFQTADIGVMNRAGKFKITKNVVNIKSYGAEYKRNWEQQTRGAFAYVASEGDFVLDATVDKHRGKGFWQSAGLTCRAGLTTTNPVTGVFAIDNRMWATAGGCTPPFKRFLWNEMAYLHEARVFLHTGPNQRQQIAQRIINTRTWDELTASALELTSATLTGLEKPLALDKADAVKTGQLDKLQSSALNSARAMAVRAKPGLILAAAKKVSAVLNTQSRSPEAHYTAALCGALLTLQDPYGHFHNRARFLAGPLSFWVMGRRLAKPKRPQDKLAAAWLAFACGYPNAALRQLKTLAPKERSSAEGKALRMFITRDYRPLTPRTAPSASTLEQLAWVWACQQCKRTDFLRDAPGQLARQSLMAAILPLQITTEVGAGHAHTTAAINLAIAADAEALLKADDLPEPNRAKAAKLLASLCGVSGEGKLPSVAKRLAHALRRDSGMASWNSTAKVLVDELYTSAKKQPSGPVTLRKDVVWQVMPVSDFAELQCGRFVLALYGRARFIGQMWGVPDAAREFCDEVATFTKSMSGVFTFFHALKPIYDDQPAKAKAETLTFLQSRTGRLPATASFVISELPEKSWKHKLLQKLMAHPGRGGWEWARLASVPEVMGIHSTFTHASHVARVDSYAMEAPRRLSYLAESVIWGESFSQRLPYHVKWINWLAWWARYLGNDEKAIDAYEKLLVLEPNNASHYSALANLFAANGKLGKAIDVAERAVKACEDTVTLSNLMGHTAERLVDEGRKDEALKWGLRAAQSYSYSGLHGYAVALEANGRTKESVQVFRAIAMRYRSGIRSYISSLVRAKADMAVFTSETQALLKMYPRSKGYVHDYVQHGLWREAADTGILDKLYKGPLSFHPVDGQKRWLLLHSMLTRDYPRAIRAYQALKKVQKPYQYCVLLAYGAARLGKLKDAQAEIRADLKVGAKKKWLGAHMRFALGEIDRKELDKSSSDTFARLTAHWLAGVQAESAGDMSAAYKCYQLSADVRLKNAHTMNYLVTAWAKQLAPKYADKKTTQKGD
jgi:tetratricopeptide (TPR) repeat protein